MAVRIDPERNEPAALTRIGARFDGARVLEIGCGDGRLTAMYARHARSVVAIDPDSLAIGEFHEASWPSHVEALPIAFDRFDASGRGFEVILLSWSL